MAINYLRRVQALRQNQGQSDVSRGIAAGEAVGKLLGGLGTAIQGAQKDAVANRLMNTMDAPRAALVSTPGGPQPGGPQPSQGVDSGDPDADLSTDLPENVSQSIGGNAPILNQAIAAQQLSGSPGTVDPNADLSTDLPDIVSPTQSVQVPGDAAMPSGTGAGAPQGGSPTTTYSGTGIDPTLASNVAAARLSSVPAPAQPALAPGVSTAGTSPHTGGVAEMDLMQKMQQMQAAKASAGSAQQEAALRLADAQAKASGTGQYSLNAAIQRANLAAAQAKVLQPKTAKTSTKPDPNAPDVDLTQSPVANQAQLVKAYESIHGTGSFAKAMSAFNEPAQIPNPNIPGQMMDNPNAPVTTANTVSFGPAAKRTNLPISEAQTFTKQANALRLKQGLSLLPVPGENDQSLGSKTNPYPVKTKLDALSRPHGSWVRTSTGQIALVP